MGTTASPGVPDAVDRFGCLKYRFLDARGRRRLAHDLACTQPLDGGSGAGGHDCPGISVGAACGGTCRYCRSAALPDRITDMDDDHCCNARPVSYTHLTLPTIYSV